ncbi:hypothetical protein RJ639_009870 [Escallonia herrerae]|uniref:Uncharacterized protein n=1 Tax=Escallonia herrerae TaxID=1293975 RepID=A0AA89AQ58_9ASTE|nr:hypothetical protein RJ639_009870 [Escallonia herrerae]
MAAEEVSIVIQTDPCSRSHSSSHEEWIKSLRSESTLGITTPAVPKIRRVPRILGNIESNKKCYEPFVVSIGPFHHGKPELEPMEKFKIPLAKQYAKECNASVIELYNKVEEVAGEAKKCYNMEGEDNVDEKEFAHMMFLDGCFILQFICCIVREKHGELMMKSHDIAFVRRDIFLLENQLPFQVLQVLMSLMFKELDQGLEMIDKFIMRSRPQHPKKMKYFFQKYFCPKRGPAEAEDKRLNLPIHLLELVRTNLSDASAFDPKRQTSNARDLHEKGCYLTGEWCSYRSAMELKTVGIHFLPSKSHRFSDITFKSTGFSSQLSLPPIHIDDSTKSMLLNLVAYEACPDTADDFGVTTYVCFMDSLIDNPEDVKELRSKGILLNFLGSDQHVADLFNEIAKDLVPNPYGFVGVKLSIEDHYKSKIKVWMAEWKHTHFSTPWTMLAFGAAIFVISLSVMQTILAAIQTYLTAHPPQGK